MSSGKFVCELGTDRRLRQCLIAGGIVAWLTGILLIALLPVPGSYRSALGALWTFSSAAELRDQWRGMARICRIRMMSDGSVEGIAADGARQAVELRSGSMVLGRSAWLRLRFADGSGFCEWLRQRGGEAEQWRVLQLIWRQRAPLFGRSGGS